MSTAVLAFQVPILGNAVYIRCTCVTIPSRLSTHFDFLIRSKSTFLFFFNHFGITSFLWILIEQTVLYRCIPDLSVLQPGQVLWCWCCCKAPRTPFKAKAGNQSVLPRVPEPSQGDQIPSRKGKCCQKVSAAGGADGIGSCECVREEFLTVMKQKSALSGWSGRF